MHQYWGFGLFIHSEIEFPELLSATSDSPDLSILFGSVDETIEETSFSGNSFAYMLSDREFLLSVFEVARYRAEDGIRITIDPIGKIHEMRVIRLHVLATVMAAVILQRNKLLLHASAVIKNEELTFIAGDSGAGKSITLAGLFSKGIKVFSDDVVVLQENGLSPVTATASYPMIKLWDDSLVKLNDELFDDRSFRIRSDMDKYGIFYHNQFITDSYPIKQILILLKRVVPVISSSCLTGSQAFDALTRQIYRPLLIQSNEMRLLCFNLLTALSKTTRIYEIKRPLDCEPEELLEYVEAFL